MPNLWYKDENGTLKMVANTDSPFLEGEPKVPNLLTFKDRDILNITDAMKYIDSVIEEFNATRLIYANSNKLEGLVKGKKYMVSIYGKFNPGLEDTYNLGPVAIKDNNNNILNTSGFMVNNLVNPKNYLPQSATLILDKAPSDGVIYGLVNYDMDSGNGVDATYIVALRLS